MTAHGGLGRTYGSRGREKLDHDRIEASELEKGRQSGPWLLVDVDMGVPLQGGDGRTCRRINLCPCS